MDEETKIEAFAILLYTAWMDAIRHEDPDHFGNAPQRDRVADWKNPRIYINRPRFRTQAEFILAILGIPNNLVGAENGV